MNRILFHIVRLYQNIRFFGVYDGIRLYLKVHFSSKNKDIYIKLKRFSNPITIRKSQTDYSVFWHVFGELHYEVSLFNSKPIETEFFNEKQIKNIVDCGSNVGYSVLFFAEKYKNAKVIGIEPEKENFEQLKKNTLAYSNVKLYQGGVWHKSVNLEIIANTKQSASFEVIEATEGGIKAFTLSEIMSENNMEYIDILKLDIEGTEKFLFENDPHQWLSKTRCLIIELHDRKQKGTSKAFFREMSKYNWQTYAKGESILCFRED